MSVSNKNSTDSKKILMAVWGFRGHAAPIMALAAELVRRGHEVTLSAGAEESVFGKKSSLWEDDAHPKVRFVFDAYDNSGLIAEVMASLGHTDKNKNNSGGETVMFMNWADMNDFQVARQIVPVMSFTYRNHFPVLDRLLLDGDFDLVIADYICTEGIDAGNLHGIPTIVNCPALRSGENCKTSTSHPLLGFPIPLVNPWHRFLNHFLFTIDIVKLIFRDFLMLRKKMLPKQVYQKGLVDVPFEHPCLFNTVIGISEVAQYEPPLNHHMGALLPKIQRDELLTIIEGNQHSPTYKKLSKDLQNWFDDVVPEVSDVIFINFGTTGAFQRWKWEVMLEAITIMANDGDKPTPYVLWRMSREQIDILGIRGNNLPNYIRLTTWIEPNQQAVLSHPKVALFVTHAGINSPQEGIACGVPLLMIPTFGDQPGHAARLVSHGLGRNLGKNRFSTDVLVEALRDLLFTGRDRYLQNVSRAQLLLKRAGGTDTAADIVEVYLETGYSHLVPSERRLPSWQGKWNLDIAVGYGLVVAAVLGVASSVVPPCIGWCSKIATKAMGRE